MTVNDVSTGRLFVSVIVRLAVVAPAANGTVISGGCQAVAAVCAEPFNAEQVAGAPTAPQVHPHIGTVLPSGKVVV
jgi:hypothetical protein